MHTRSKLEIGRVLTSVLPIIFSIMVVCHSICAYYDYEPHILNYLGGTSILVWAYFLWNSNMYGMCLHHRMFIYYLIVTGTIGIIDDSIGIPINDFNYMLIYVISFGISTIFYGILKFRDNQKVNK